jgi:hypothetical protein
VPDAAVATFDIREDDLVTGIQARPHDATYLRNPESLSTPNDAPS